MKKKFDFSAVQEDEDDPSIDNALDKALINSSVDFGRV